MTARTAIDPNRLAHAVERLRPLADAIARGAEVRVRLEEAAGGFLSTAAAGTVLNLSYGQVDRRRRAGRILAIRIGGHWRYPATQFRNGEVLEGIPEIISGLSDTTPWAVLDFLLAPSDALGGRAPIAALQTGDGEVVLRQVAAHQADAFS